jgi:hypothetical protein
LRTELAIQNEHFARERTVKAAVQAAVGRLEETVRSQASQMDRLKAEKQKFEDVLKAKTEANELLRREVEKLQQMAAKPPPKPVKQFPPSMKRGRDFDVPDGIIAHLTRECGGNVHERKVVRVTSGSFEAMVYVEAGSLKNIVDLETDSSFYTSFRSCPESIAHTRNSWLCHDFRKRMIVPTHYAIRTNDQSPGGLHLKSWLVETSADGETWREVHRKEDTWELNGRHFTRTFAVAGGVA